MRNSEENTRHDYSSILNEYEQFLEGKAEGTREAYLRTVRHLMEWMAQVPGNEGSFQPQQVTQAVIEKYLNHLEQEGFSSSHCARVKSTISNFAQFLIEEKGYIQRNPTRGIDLSPVPPSAAYPLSKEQRAILRSLVKHAGDRRGAALFALTYWGGCRVRELSWLRMEHTHVGPEEGWLHLGDKEKERDIDLAKQAYKPLFAYLQTTRNQERTYVFTSQRSERLTEEGIYAWFRGLKEQATDDQWKVINHLTLDDVRQDFAYRAREAGWSFEEVAFYLGTITRQGVPVLQSVIYNTQIRQEQIK